MAAPVDVLQRPTKPDSLMDPYLNFKWLVSWATTSGGKANPVAYVSRIGALSMSTQVVSWREGGAPQGVRRIPGQTEYGPITLERGVTIDVNFEEWANKVWYYPNTNKLGNEVSLKDFRRNITIELMNQAGQVVLVYDVFNCWPSEYIALPELDSSANAVALQSLTLQNEGWIRDDSVKPPDYPSYSDPSSPYFSNYTAPST